MKITLLIATLMAAATTAISAENTPVAVTDIAVPDAIYIGRLMPLCFTAANTGENDFQDQLTPCLLNSDSVVVAKGENLPLNLMGGETKAYQDIITTFSPLEDADCGEGAYRLVFRDSKSRNVSALVKVDVKADPGTATIAVRTFELITLRPIIDKSSVEFNIGLSCSEGYFSGTLNVVIFPYIKEPGESETEAPVLYTAGTPYYFLSAGEQATRTVGLDLSELEIGRYVAKIYDEDGPVSDKQVVFRLEPEYPATMASGTLPIIYINTEDAKPVVDKVTPIPAGLFVTVPEGSEYEALGSEGEPIALTIRGRGNSSWTIDKKPYKLKFDKKTSMLGMPKSKHFALLHHNQGYTDYMTSMSAMEMMRELTGKWAPHMVPVEVVFNGRYDGLYFLAETIKIDKDRLNIFEQNDGETDPEVIPYGWLIEIDNNPDEYQFIIPETEEMNLRVTYKSPEELSEEQLDWITAEFEKIVASVYGREEELEDWTEIIDVQSAAAYFIVRELYHDWDGYSGSFYLHRDSGESAKWNFGPLWDVTFCEWSKPDWVVNSHAPFAQTHLIAPMMNHQAFKDAVNELWDAKFPALLDHINNYLNEIATITDAADKVNYNRWPDISNNSGAYPRATWVQTGLANSYQWMNEHVKDGITGVKKILIDEAASSAAGVEYFNLQGIPVRVPSPGLYLRRQGSKIEKVIIN